MGSPPCSVVVRTLDSARTVGALLDDLDAQTVRPQIIVVDSGSSDATLDLVAGRCDALLRMKRRDYRPGRALNLGSDAAAGDVVLALSSHCRLPSPDWVERSLAHFADPLVAGTCGAERGPDHQLLVTPYRQRRDDVTRAPLWGFSNHASAWRRDVWLEHPFDDELPTAEDKEWALRVLDAGWQLVFDPGLYVDMSHRWRAGTLAFLRRECFERRILHRYLEPPPYELADALRDWWWPANARRPTAVERLNYRRLAGLVGIHLGDRAGRRDRGRMTDRPRPERIPGPRPPAAGDR